VVLVPLIAGWVLKGRDAIEQHLFRSVQLVKATDYGALPIDDKTCLTFLSSCEYVGH
jgi:hypothetical protein